MTAKELEDLADQLDQLAPILQKAHQTISNSEFRPDPKSPVLHAQSATIGAAKEIRDFVRWRIQ